MSMYPQAYGQMGMQMQQPMGMQMQQPMGMQMQQEAYAQMQMQQSMAQMGYPKMNPDGSFAGVYQPNGMQMQMGYPSGMQLPPVRASSGRSLWEYHSYSDDIARFHGWVMSQLGRVFHERGRALKICIPSAAFAVFFIIISTVMVYDLESGNADAELRECTVLLTRSAKVPGAPSLVRPTVHAVVVGETAERVVTRFREPADFQVEPEESRQYLTRYCTGCNIPCYQFKDGAVQLDDAEYTSFWNYVIMVILLLSAFICCCVWLSSGTFACCSPLITVTLQA